jgi:histidyl-tRNA synthetase
MDILYEINSGLVRGLDYYTKTVFEIWSDDDEYGSLSLGGGGRYDYLVKNLGGKDTPGVGFAAGIDRIVMSMKKKNIKPQSNLTPKIYLAQLGNLAKKKSLKIFEELQKAGIPVLESFGKGNLRSQLRQANQLGVETVLIIGQREALDETVIIKDMISGNQEISTFQKVIKGLKKRRQKAVRIKKK